MTGDHSERSGAGNRTADSICAKANRGSTTFSRLTQWFIQHLPTGRRRKLAQSRAAEVLETRAMLSAAVPYFEDFNSGDLESTDLTFATELLGSTSLNSHPSVFNGSRYLHLAPSASTSDPSQEYVMLELDLSSVATATDLILDFSGVNIGSSSINNSTGVYLSADGTDWRLIDSTHGSAGDEINYAYDLDAELASLGINLDSNVHVLIRHFGSNPLHSFGVDNLRVARRDGFGPAVSSLSPSGTVEKPITRLDVTFDEPIDIATFTRADVTIVNPAGHSVDLLSDPVNSGDQTTFSLNFAEPQTINGQLVVRIGSDIFDLSGNQMNHDGDNRNGESIRRDDRFETALTIGPTTAVTIPYRQSFEDAALTQLDAWAFSVGGSGGDDGDGTIELAEQLLPQKTAQAGRQVLLFDERSSTGTIQTAALKIDFSDVAAATDLELSFFVQRRGSNSGNNSLDLAVSDDGLVWKSVQGELGGSAGEWEKYSFDLDAILAARGIPLDMNTFVRFRHFGSSAAHEFAVDDVRIGRSPLTVDISVDELTEGDAATYNVTVTRDSEADPSAAVDVMLTSSHPQEINIPGMVTIPADTDSVTFPITVVDDVIVDGPQLVEIRAAALGLMVGTDTVTIHDNEPSTLLLSVDQPVVNEATGPAAAVGTVVRNQDIDVPLIVNLASSDELAVTVPASVTIPAGTTFVSFDIATHNDFAVDGVQTATVTGTAADYADGSLQISVEDDDTVIDRTIGGRFSGTLPADEYRATLNVDVIAGTELTISPGATLRFEQDLGLNVGGTLTAIGTESSPIVLTSSDITPAAGDWNGVRLAALDEPRSQLSFVEVGYALTGVEVNEDDTSLTLSNSKIHHNTWYGVNIEMGHRESVTSTQVVISGNKIHDNGTQGVLISASKSGASSGGSFNGAAVVGNEIHHNADYGIKVTGSAGSATLTFGGGGSAEPIVTGNDIHDNDAGGILVTASHSSSAAGGASALGVYQNNLIISNGGPGIRLDKSGDARVAPEVFNNTIAHNLGAGLFHGIDLESSSEKIGFFNNIVVSNEDGGVVADQPFVPNADMLGYNDVFGNDGGDWVNYPSEYGKLTTVNANGDPTDAFFNLSIDPQFLSEADYHLQSDSPLINAGTGNDPFAPITDFDLESRVAKPDIGFDEVRGAGFRVSETSGNTTVSELGSTDTVSVVLTAQPLEDVVILVGLDDPTEALMNKTNLTFTAANWDLPQVVQITGVDDSLDDGHQVSTLIFTVDVANSDVVFHSLADQLVAVTTSDNEAPDLVATLFNAVNDYVPGAQVEVDYQVRNIGTGTAGSFATQVVWSPNNFFGDADDILVADSVASVPSLPPGASVNRTIHVSLNATELYAHALQHSIPGEAVGTDSHQVSHVFLVVDVNQQIAELNETNNSGIGHLIDSDDISYFPWDTDGNGTVTPQEALSTIRAVNSPDPIHDFDGNGVVTPLEALSVLQRIGYRRNVGVEDQSFSPLHSAFAESPLPTQPGALSSDAVSSVFAFCVRTEDDDDELFAIPAGPADQVAFFEDSTDDVATTDAQFEEALAWLSLL